MLKQRGVKIIMDKGAELKKKTGFNYKFVTAGNCRQTIKQMMERSSQHSLNNLNHSKPSVSEHFARKIRSLTCGKTTFKENHNMTSLTDCKGSCAQAANQKTPLVRFGSQHIQSLLKQ